VFSISLRERAIPVGHYVPLLEFNHQWETLLAAAADRDTMDETWEKWNAGIEELIAGLEARSIPYVRVLLDIEEIEQFCEEQGIPNDAKARSNLAIRKAEQNAR